MTKQVRPDVAKTKQSIGENQIYLGALDALMPAMAAA